MSTSSKFSCFDGAGSRLSASPDRLAITHGLAAADPPLSLSISVLAYDDDGQETLFRMLDKGVALPAVRERSFRTARQLMPGQGGEALRIHVFEGEHGRSDLDKHVGWIEITDSQVHQPLAAGTPVDVKLRVDASRGIVVSVYISLIDLSIENVIQEKYRPSVELGALEQTLAAELERAKQVGEDRPDDLDAIENDARAVEREIQVASAGDRDAADKADIALKELRASIDRLEAETETVRLQKRVEFERDAARSVVREYGVRGPNAACAA